MTCWWIMGGTRTGKTTRLVAQFQQWVEQGLAAEGTVNHSVQPIRLPSPSRRAALHQTASQILVLAATGENRLLLVDRLMAVTGGDCTIVSTTPLGFFQQEVLRYWPLLIPTLDLKAQFPVLLRSENEQELATRLWQPELEAGLLQQPGLGEHRVVRRVLDLFQLAALAGIPVEEIETRLEQGFPAVATDGIMLPPWAAVGRCLQRWRAWCWDHGLLTYGVVTELFWRYLLPDPFYQQHLQRYRAVLADDVDNYPAIARLLFEKLLDQGATAAFTFNPEGAVRLGLGADPDYLAGLQDRCEAVTLSPPTVKSLADLDDAVVQLVDNPLFLAPLPADAVQVIQSPAHAQLLQQIATVIQAGIQTEQIQPGEVAIIAPGLEGVTRFALGELLSQHGVAVEALNEQRPLISAPIIRSLLTLLALVYPGLGRLINREQVAEMLVFLSQRPQLNRGLGAEIPVADGGSVRLSPQIDPVRAGLLADHCFDPHPDRPQLLPVDAFPRWDRLGHQAVTAYDSLRGWLADQQQQQAQRLIPTAIVLLDRAIQHFFQGGTALPYDQVAALRELMETAQRYWKIADRLNQTTPALPAGSSMDTASTLARFIRLLQSGAVSANPYPLRPAGTSRAAVTLATVFQYRAYRSTHRWQFWLDIGSMRWLSGMDALFGAQLFLRDWSGQPWTEADADRFYQQRLRRILRDLLARTSDRVYLCHSDLAISGQEQMGPLLALTSATTSL